MTAARPSIGGVAFSNLHGAGSRRSSCSTPKQPSSGNPRRDALRKNARPEKVWRKPRDVHRPLGSVFRRVSRSRTRLSVVRLGDDHARVAVGSTWFANAPRPSPKARKAQAGPAFASRERKGKRHDGPAAVD